MSTAMHSTERQELRRLLRELRIAAGLRQSDLATRIGHPQSFVSKYETGERRLDLIDTREVCRALGVPLVHLLLEPERRIGEATHEAQP